MKTKRRQSGLSLTEIAVIIATIALLVGLSVPAVRAFINSFETGSSTKSIINSALFNARAIAAKEQKYAGVRFQKAYQAEGPLEAPQYMVFIIHDPEIPPSVAGNLGCRVVKGLKPIKLPKNVGVTDLLLGSNDDEEVDTDAEINNLDSLVDVTTFSILFSPSGKLILHTHKAQKRDLNDDVFNTKEYIEIRYQQENKTKMFIEDKDLNSVQPVDEASRNSFIIYDRAQFNKTDVNSRWTDYLSKLESERIYINAYTGTIINK